MNKDVSAIKDPAFAAAVSRLADGVERKHNKPAYVPRSRPPPDRNDWLLRNGTPEQAAESARLARQRQGEKED